MKIGILSRKEELYSTRRLVEAAKTRGHDVHVIDHARCYMNITSHHPAIHYKGEQLVGFDAIIPRIGASITFYGTAVVRQFEMMDVYCLNESVAISRSRDKLRGMQLLARRGIGLPVTGFAPFSAVPWLFLPEESTTSSWTPWSHLSSSIRQYPIIFGDTGSTP